MVEDGPDRVVVPLHGGSLLNRWITHACPAVVLGGLSLGLFAGCADVVTYANDARRDGLKNMKDGNTVDAAGSFRNAVRQDPRDYKSYYYLGQCYDEMGSQNQAVQAYRSGLDVMNITVEGREDRKFRLQTIDALAASLAKSGVRTFDTQAAAGKSKPAEQKFITAKAYRHLGDADNALANYQQASLLDPNDVAIAKEYGLFLEQTGQADQARPVLKRAYAMDMKDQEVAAALRRVGVVPGPSLKERNELVKPPIPQGPLPEANLGKVGNVLKYGNTGGDRSPVAQPASGTVAAEPQPAAPTAPRD
jgi:tetratricopeptide (TPR) repeat protein